MAKKKKTKKKKKTAKKTAAPVKEEVFYVGIQDPIELKNSMLESSKDLMQYLDRFEKLKEIRERKKSEMEHLRRIFNEITKDTNKLKRYLPKTKLRIQIHEEKIKKTKKKTAKKIMPKPLPMKKLPKEEKSELHDEELAKLEEELSKIEGRLTNLT